MKKHQGMLLAMILIAAITACKKDSKDDTTQNLALLALLNTRNGLSPEQKTASATANGVVGAASAAQTSGGMTASNEAQTEQMLVADIFENGMDPVVVRDVASQLASLQKEKQENPVHLTAITATPSGTTPNQTWTFSGSVNGSGVTTQSNTTFGLALGIPNCAISTLAPSGTQGTATFSNGTLAFSGSGTSGAFSGTSNLSANIAFSNYGVFYTDYLAMIQYYKNPPSTTSSISTCEGLQQVFGSFYNAIAKYAVISAGSAAVTYSRTYSGQNAASGVSSNSKFDATVSSPSGLTMTEYEGTTAGAAKTVTLQNVKYGYSSSISLSGSPSAPVGSGSFSVSFSGIVNGTAIDQIFSFSF
ncbi:hypothetical protein [Leptospira yasudae]|uniref:hypothetical protein n=1 Tax=Leptospira yasudae TaxID=2202201 RepID=UPI001090E453|nr:hypothetical protein [Leptospira yasudae]MBW0433452.1 hypothetical protein [Leptospira yasudae]TGN00604.1 hypothetical protein EHR10_02840 [Leptospira yasudae]